MPYRIKSTKSGYEVVRADTGAVVAHSKSLQGARGYVWHASQGDRKAKGPVHHGNKKKKAKS